MATPITFANRNVNMNIALSDQGDVIDVLSDQGDVIDVLSDQGDVAVATFAISIHVIASHGSCKSL